MLEGFLSYVCGVEMCICLILSIPFFSGISQSTVEFLDSHFGGKDSVAHYVFNVFLAVMVLLFAGAFTSSCCGPNEEICQFSSYILVNDNPYLLDVISPYVQLV